MKGGRLEDDAIVEIFAVYPKLETAGCPDAVSRWPASIRLADSGIPGFIPSPSRFVPNDGEDGAIAIGGAWPNGNDVGEVPLPPPASPMGPFGTTLGEEVPDVGPEIL